MIYSIHRMAPFLFLSAVMSCAYGPKAERKTPLSYLSGENYETTSSGQVNQLVVPVVKRKEQATTIEGQVLIGEGIETSQLRNVQVGLYDQQGHLMLTSTSFEGGQFKIQTPIHNGKYVLKLVSDYYQGETPIEVSSYTVSNVLIRADQKR